MENKLKLQNTATVPGISLFYGLLLFNISFIAAKHITPVRHHFSIFFSHSSNFVITSILVSIISLIWLLQGAPFKLLIYLASIAVALNFIIELFVRWMNTPDVIDAVYGTAGAVITLLIMLLIKKKGLKPNPDA